MKDRRPGWLGGGLVVVGLALIVVGSAVDGIAGYGPGKRTAAMAGTIAALVLIAFRVAVKLHQHRIIYF